MLLVLNFCHSDRDLALKLLQWCGELQCGAKHDLLLHFSQQVKRTDQHLELEELAKKHFLSVSTATPPTEDERGWPHSPNHGWMSALQIVRERIMKPWLWLEPDATPLTRECFDAIEAEYVRVNPPPAVVKTDVKPMFGAKQKAEPPPPKTFPFMGAEITSPAHRMSGVAVYPPQVVSFLHKRLLSDLVAVRSRFGAEMGPREEAFDSYFAAEILPYCHFTPLIQNVHLTSRDPDIAPTFPTMESLSLLDPRAVLFHRCKDGSLIDRLRERRGELDSSQSHKLAPVGSIPTPAIIPDYSKALEPRQFPEGMGETVSGHVLPSAREKALQSELDRLRALLDPRSTPAGAIENKKSAASERMKRAWAFRKMKAQKKADRAARKLAKQQQNATA